MAPNQGTTGILPQRYTSTSSTSHRLFRRSSLVVDDVDLCRILPPPMMNIAVLSLTLAAAPDAALQQKVQDIFDESCTMCHEDEDLNLADLSTNLPTLMSQTGVNGEPFIVPGDPSKSYLLTKMNGQGPFEGDLMPQGEDPLPADQLQAVADWISSMGGAAPTGGGDSPATGPTPGPTTPVAPPPKKADPAFRGETHIIIPTTTTLGPMTLQWNLGHRFGRIGSERGFLGLDGPVVMSMGLTIGILKGWDASIHRSNLRKSWQFATKYVPLRQEDDMPLSLGAYVSLDVLRDPSLEYNTVSGNFMVMVSRLWFERWATQLSLSYHTGTNKDIAPTVDFGDGAGFVPAEDKRGTLDIGIASSVRLGKKRKWALDVEYFQPIPGGGSPNTFYYRSGDGDPNDANTFPIGSWAIGGSYFTGKHLFQVFFTNNNNIHLNQAAPGGTTINPFNVDEETNTFLNELNFYIGFNLIRRFSLGTNAKRWKKDREDKIKAQRFGG